MRQAEEIFGNEDDELELPHAYSIPGQEVKEEEDIPMESFFNADEIDDPLSTPHDKKIEQTDICERL